MPCNDRWSGLIVQVRMQSFGHSKKSWIIRLATMVRKMTAKKEIEHNSTTAQAEKEQKITMY